jgi:hypothetical protein
MTQMRKKSGINSSSRVLGGKTFAAISAVEGLKLSASSEKRLSSLKERKLSPDQKRAEVLRAYDKYKSR